MTISFLPPDIEQVTCCVTVGVAGGASDTCELVQSFRGLVDVRQLSESGSAVSCEALLLQCENRQDVDVVLPHSGSTSRKHRITVSVAASPFPALDSVACTVLAPAFVPGGIGIDWDDVCRILGSGKRGVLAVIESGEAVIDTLKLVESVLAKEDCDRVSGVMAALFAPQGSGWLETIRQLGRTIETLAPSAERLVAAPVILGSAPICAVLAVFADYPVG